MKTKSPILSAAIVVGTLISAPAAAQSFQPGTSYDVCFTPGQNCQKLITDKIAAAKTSIQMQAYSFTSPAIAAALVAAHKRGVTVIAVLDKSQRSSRYTGATFLRNAGIPVFIDYKPAIAHSKIIIIDSDASDSVVITGSFNFTAAAQNKNAENVIAITGDKQLTRAYSGNFAARAELSEPYEVLKR